MPQATQQVILPNEYQQQVGQSQQRQQLVQALAAQLMKAPQGQVVGGVYTGGPNAGSALTQILGTLAMGKSLDRQQEFERDALNKYRAGERQAITDYLGGSAQGPNREAIINAMTSPYSSLQGIAGKDYEQMNKENTPLTRLVASATGLGGGQGANPQAAQKLQELFPGMSLAEIVTGLAADPSGKELTKAVYERGGPKIIPDSGTLVTGNPGTGYQPAAGAGDAQAANVARLQDIKNRSQAAYDVSTPIETPAGVSIPTRLQMVQAANGAPGPVNLGPAQGTRSGMQIPPQVQNQRDGERLQILQQELQQTTNPADQQALQREIARVQQGMAGRTPMASGAAPSPVPGVQIPYNSASKAADKGVREDDVKVFSDAREKARSAGQALNQIAEMRKAVKGGTFAGGYANLQERVAAFAGPLGIPIDQSRLSDTQYVKSTLQNLIVPQVKKLGVNPTDADAKRIEAMVGSITTDPAAFDKIMGLLEKSAKKDMDTFRRMDSHLRKNNSLEGFDYQLEQPGSTAAAPMTLDEYLKSRSK